MNAFRRQKLFTVTLIIGILGLVIGLVLYALRQNISLFYTPSQVTTTEVPLHHPIRVGGMVVKNSVSRGQDLVVQFQITDFQHVLTISYKGILPDLFREGQGVVVQGELLDKTHFNASRVLAKHDENYMPPEVKAALAGRKEEA